MTTRIASLASNNELVNIILGTQRRLQESEVQVASQKKSQIYAGIAEQSERLVNLETARSALDRFVTQNEIVDLRLKTQDSVVNGMEDSIKQFREALLSFEAGGPDVEERVATAQDAAFRALKDLEIFLNTDVDGRFLFSGSRITNKTADFGLTTLADFQATYDGSTVLYPPTRGGHLANFTTDTANTGNLTLDAANNTITAATAGSLADIAVGTKITLAGSTADDGDYTVVTNDGTTIEVAGTLTGTAVTAAGDITGNEAVAATLSASSYYGGDSQTQTHRVARDREFSVDLNAIDPAFEKAIRAIGLIAQGEFGTAGGLDQNTDRIEDALFLVNSALDPTVPGTPPFGAEQSGNFDQVLTDLAFERVLIDQTNTNHKRLITFFDDRSSEIEDQDRLEAVTRLLADQQVLEASFQALARIRNLTLADFLSV